MARRGANAPVIALGFFGLLALWIWKGPWLGGTLLDPLIGGNSGRAVIVSAVASTLMLWVAAIGCVGARLLGQGQRRLLRSPAAGSAWFLLLLPTFLLLPGGRTGVSERWLNQMNEATGGVADEVAAGWLAGFFSVIAGLLIGAAILASIDKRTRRRGLNRGDGERRDARERDVLVAAMVATQVGLLALVLRNEWW